MRNIRAVTFEDLEFQNGKLVKVHPYDRYQYMSGDELIALVGRLGEMLYEAHNAPAGSADWQTSPPLAPSDAVTERNVNDNDTKD